MGFQLTFRRRIILALLATAFLSLMITGYLSYESANTSLREAAKERLNAVRENKKRAIESYFSNLREQLNVLSHDLTVIEAIGDFKDAYNSPAVKNGISDSEKEELRSFYQKEFLPRIEKNTGEKFDYQMFFPEDPRAQYLQYAYLVKNANPVGQKNKLLKSTIDNNAYHEVHERYHPILSKYLSSLKLYDIFIIDPKDGAIVYTNFKEIDFATSLVHGPHKNTNFADVYRSVIKITDENYTRLVDYEPYAPSYNLPASFMATGIYKNGELIGVLAFQMPTSVINGVMTGDNNWKDEGLGETGETFLVGHDSKMRSDARPLSVNKDGYLKALKESGADAKSVYRVREMNTTILEQSILSEDVKQALAGQSGWNVVKGYRGNESLSSFSPLKIADVKWAIVAAIDTDEAFDASSQLLYRILAVAGIIFLLVFILAVLIANSIAQPIRYVQGQIEQLSLGILPKNMRRVEILDEIGFMIQSVNTLISRFSETAKFAQQIGEQNLNAELQVSGSEDVIGNALITMRDNLRIVAEEEEFRAWQTDCVGMINDNLRANGEFEDVLQTTFIRFLEYIGASQLAIYMIRDVGRKRQLEPLMHIGFDKEHLQNPDLTLDEGILGKVMRSSKPEHLTEVPAGFGGVKFLSGEMAVKEVYISPLLINESPVGLIELTTMKTFTPAMLEVFPRVFAAIANAIFVFETNRKTARLLEETRNVNNELKAQEEELRQNAEEMQAVNEELERRSADILRAQKELQQKNEAMAAAQEELLRQKEELERANANAHQVNNELRAQEEEMRQNAEELQSVNDELERRTTEIMQAQRDLENANRDMIKAQRDLESKNNSLLTAQQELNAAMKSLRENEQNLEKQVQERTAQFEAAKDEAERANQIKSLFLANMSHELRTPLNGILGYAQLLLSSNDIPANHKQKIGIINKSGEHLLNLINEVLDLSKIEAGKMELIPTEVNLENILQTIYDMFNLRCQQKGLSLGIEIDDRLNSNIIADEGKLRQCIINLLGNAVKFTAEGSVKMDVRLDGTNKIRFAIIDTGRGIPKDKIEEILKPFQQIYGELNTEGGTGLGLSITKSYIELMGGKLEIQSEYGKGSTFSFTIPLQFVGQPTPKPEAVNPFNSDAAVKETVARTNQNGNGSANGQPATVKAVISTKKELTIRKVAGIKDNKKIKVLITDDNEINRHVASEGLNAVGFITESAENGKIAVEKFQTFKPDVILMDIKMPVMDGMEATQRIRQLPGSNATTVKIVALTASVFEQERRVFLDKGCDTYLGKPYKFEQLFNVIQELIGIEYVYEESAPLPQMKSSSSFDSPKLFGMLPNDLLAELSESFEFGDYVGLEAAVDKIPEDKPELKEFKDYLKQQLQDMAHDSLDRIFAHLVK